MEGKKILGEQVGKYLEAGKIQSFYLNGELVDRINVTFLKFNHWIRIVSADEKTIISVDNEDIENVSAFGDKEFFYSIKPIEKYFPDFIKYLNKKLVGFKELVWTKNEHFSFGVHLYFEGGLSFIIYNQYDSIDRNEYRFNNHIPDNLTEK